MQLSSLCASAACGLARMLALLITSQPGTGKARGKQLFNWDEPSKLEDLRVRRQGIARRAWAAPGTGLRDVLAYNELQIPPADAVRSSLGGQPVLRCNTTHASNAPACKTPIRMRTGLRLCGSAGMHDIIEHPDGRHMAEVVEELRFIQVIVPAVIGRARPGLGGHD